MSVLTIQIDEQVRAEATAVLNACGLSISDVVEMTLKKIATEKRLPADFSAASADDTEIVDDDLTRLPAFGMWADREDMKNPTEWVKNLRRARYHDL